MVIRLWVFDLQSSVRENGISNTIGTLYLLSLPTPGFYGVETHLFNTQKYHVIPFIARTTHPTVLDYQP